jgi:PAS domain S-box-containing protein
MASGVRSEIESDWPDPLVVVPQVFALGEAEALLQSLAALHSRSSRGSSDPSTAGPDPPSTVAADESLPILEARYRALIEQMSAIVFMAYLDRGISEAYVSPQIEATLGFSQQEWLEDPVRWYAQIHSDEKERWSREAAGLLLTGKPLRSVYRVLARDGHVVWFHCEAKIVRRADGTPWFIQGVGFDITDLKRAEAALQEERNVLSTILDTVGALVVVLHPNGRIARFNRACELTTGYSFDEVHGRCLWDLFMVPDEIERFKATFAELGCGRLPSDYETFWKTRLGTRRRIAWSSTVLPRSDGSVEYIIATGIDVTERQRLQKTILEISDQEARRIGQDLHDGLGQHLTGIAFMSKVLEQKLAEQRLPDAADADKILVLVNEAINKTRELARGLVSVVSDEHGLTSALRQIAVDVEDLIKISCHFQCDCRFDMGDLSAATHLCHIAREAVNNAIKHGGAKTITIALSAAGASGVLAIHDDGAGFPAVPANETGMGLHIMRYRASMIGGTLQVENDTAGGTVIKCRFPLKVPPSASTA